MIQRIARSAPGWARCWTRIYTTGLPQQVREERRDEIESDVWEELHAPGPASRAPLSILRRSVAGMPADITWRVEQPSPGAGLQRAIQFAAGTTGAGGRWLGQTAMPRLIVMVAATLALVGLLLLVTLQAGEAATQGGRLAVGMLLLLAGTFMLAGTQVRNDQPLIGASFVAAPALLLGLILWWTLVAPLVAVLITASVSSHARRARRSAPGGNRSAPRNGSDEEAGGDSDPRA